MLGRLLGGREVRDADLAATLIALRGQGSATDSGEVVTDETAMRLSTVWACVDLIARTGSTLPCDTVRYSGGSRVEVNKGSLLREPAAGMTLTAWLYAQYQSLLLRGNAYGRVVALTPDGRFPAQIEPLHPDCVSWSSRRLPGSGTQWVPRVDGVETRVWPLGDLWHLPAYTVAGFPFGLSPLSYGRQAIGAGLAAERFASRYFGSDGHPSSIIYSDKDLTRQHAQAVKDSFRDATMAGREPAVFGAGLKYEAIQISPEESQFLESQRFSVEQVARFFGVNPEMIGGSMSGSSLTYANREQRTLDFLAFTMNPWLIRMEEALTSLLPRPQVVKFNTNALLRADTKTRYEVYQIASGIQTLTRNEIRAFEDMPPLDGGDDFADLTPDPTQVQLMPDPNATEDEPRSMTINVDANTTVESGAIRSEVTVPERQTTVENHVDARTDVHEGAVQVEVPVDATTALTEDSIRVDVHGGSDNELRSALTEQTEAIAELRAEVAKPKPLTRKRVITDEIGRITAVEEEEI